MSRYIIGIDLAKLHDYTAVTVIDTELYANDGKYAVTTVYRYPIGIEYNRIAEHILDQALAHPYYGDVTLVVDATGLGNPILDLLRSRLDSVIGISITGGSKSSTEGDNIRVPKVGLIAGLLSLIENRRIYFAANAIHLDALVQELMAFQGKFSETGRVQYEGRGAHDDMVMSLAICAWYAIEGIALKTRPMIYTW